MKKILKFLFLSIIISCGNNQDSTADSKASYATEGFWERIGTIQIVNGVSVDTIYWDDLELETRPSILCVTQKRAFMPLYIVLGQQRACMPVYIGKSGDLVG